MRPTRDTYTVLVYVEVELHPKSMIVHDPGSVASSVRANLLKLLPTATTKMGLKFVVDTVSVEATEKTPALSKEIAA
jgi:hypothetical protein